MFPFGVGVRVLRAVRVPDPYGGPDVLDWDQDPNAVAVHPGCHVFATMGTEDPAAGRVDREEQTITIRGLTPGADVDEKDRVEVLAGEYAGMWEVVGRPQRWAHPFTGWTPGTVIECVGVTG